MKRILFFSCLLFLPLICFSELNIPRKIYGVIPHANSDRLYEIQVGAFKNIRNGAKYISILEENRYVPVFERYRDFTRVKITGIPASEVRNYLVKMKRMGFDEVIIREDTTEYILAEEEPEEIIEEIIEEEIEEEIIEEIIEETPEPVVIDIDIFCRTWVVVNSDNADYIGYYMLFSDDGTYLITNANGESYVAKWRWHDELNEFEYSHNNWRSYVRIKINKLDQTTLIFNDPGHNILGNGYSPLGKDISYELAPLYNPDEPE